MDETFTMLTRIDGSLEVDRVQEDRRRDADGIDIALGQQFLMVAIDACFVRAGDIGLGLVDAVRVDVADGCEARARIVRHVGAAAAGPDDAERSSGLHQQDIGGDAGQGMPSG
jgi:hypothetical protein